MAVQFAHTSIGVRLVALWSVFWVVLDSHESIVLKFHVSRRWWWLTAALLLSAYAYVRPFVRTGLGSAFKGNLSVNACYLAWLVGATFYHLPSLDTLGLDLRADLSMFIVVFVATLATLSLIWGLHEVLVRLRVLVPQMSVAPGVRTRQVLGVLLVNSASLALACSSYHSACGNGLVPEAPGATPGARSSSMARQVRMAICAQWLQPVPTSRYPTFAAWMLRGEGAGGWSSAANAMAASANANAPPAAPSAPSSAFASLANMSSVLVDAFMAVGPSGGGGGGGGEDSEAGGVLSPVLTLWCTLMMLYIANTVMDHAAASSLHAAHMSEIRPDLPEPSPIPDPGPAGMHAFPAGLPPLGSSSTIPSASQSSARRQLGRSQSLSGVNKRAGGGFGAAGWDGGVLGSGAAGVGPGGGRSGRSVRSRDPLEVRHKPISKVSSLPSFSASAAALGRRMMHSGPMQTLVRDTAWLGSHAAGLWGVARRSLSMSGSGFGGGLGAWGQAVLHGTSGGGAATTAMWGASSVWCGAAAAHGVMQLSLAAWVGHVISSMHGKQVLPTDSGGWSCAVGAGVGPMPFSSAMLAEQAVAAGEAMPAAVADVAAAVPQPDFLPMVPWYSGTSADLLKTCLDLIVSVKLFLGRFDMRTMQATTSASVFNGVPSEGDGFTFEHCDSREELWLDFIADTGDGGNSTYCVARALAAPQLTVTVPDHLVDALPPQPSASSTPSMELPLDSAQHAQHQAAPQGAPPAGRPQQDGAAGGAKHEGTGHGGGPGAAGTGSGAKGGGGGAGGGSSAAGVLGGEGGGGGGGMRMVLPRGDVLVLGGDLAYPNPTKDTYEQRLLRPFQDALPPPPHHHAERLVVHKPDLPPLYGVLEAMLAGGPHGISPPANRHASSAALRAYPGPSCFAIPGNHDWIDGLETFINFIQHKGWLGGWLLPQEKSYFALKLPHGWWMFGLDLGLNRDIDMCQLRFFANVVEQRLNPDDNVVVVTHEPTWLLEWYWQDLGSPHLHQLVRGHLRGRARVHLAGDLHFYMRHSFKPPGWASINPSANPSPAPDGPLAFASAQCAASTAPTATLAAAAVGVASGAQPQPSAPPSTAFTAPSKQQQQQCHVGQELRQPEKPHTGLESGHPVAATSLPLRITTSCSSSIGRPAATKAAGLLAAALSTSASARPPAAPSHTIPDAGTLGRVTLTQGASTAVAPTVPATHTQAPSGGATAALPIPCPTDTRAAGSDKDMLMPLGVSPAWHGQGEQPLAAPLGVSLTSAHHMFLGSSASPPTLTLGAAAAATAGSSLGLMPLAGALATTGSSPCAMPKALGLAVAAVATAGSSPTGPQVLSMCRSSSSLGLGGNATLGLTLGARGGAPDRAVPPSALGLGPRGQGAQPPGPVQGGSLPGGVAGPAWEQAATLQRGSSILGGSSDEESESSFSVASAWSRSVRRLNRDRSTGQGRHLTPLQVQDLGLGPMLSNNTSSAAHARGAAPAAQRPPSLAAGVLGVAAMQPEALAGRCEACQARARELMHATFDPEHLIVNGAGGAFLHPTHVFAPACFVPPTDPTAEATAALYSAARLPCTCHVYPYDGTRAWGAGAGGLNVLWGAGAACAAAPGLAGQDQGGGDGGRQERSGGDKSTPAPLQGQGQGTAAHGPQDKQRDKQHPGQRWPAPLSYAAGVAGAPPAATATKRPAGAAQQRPSPAHAHKQQQEKQQPQLLPAEAARHGYYSCDVSYPTPERSLGLGKKNLHLFRLKNTRFDVIGGVLYFLLVISVMPRCQSPGPLGSVLLSLTDASKPLPTTATLLNATGWAPASAGAVPRAAPAVPTAAAAPFMAAACTAAGVPGAGAEPARVCGGAGGGGSAAGAGVNSDGGVGPVGGVAAILDADTVAGTLLAIAAAYMDVVWSILMESHVSLVVTLLLLAVCVGLARGGGVGAVREGRAAIRPQDSARTHQQGLFFSNVSMPQPLLPARVGGLPSQLAWGAAHALAHLMVAITLLLVLELGVEMCIRHEQLGRDGMHSLYRWYLRFEAEHFPDPHNLRLMLKRCTLGLYPNVIKGAMAVFDIPEQVAVTRIAACQAGGTLAGLSRLQVIAYYAGMLSYFWLLATPAVGAVFGLYLFVSCWCGVHFDEAFSSLRVPNHKAITRMHITPGGDLHLYTLAIDRVPTSWREDPRWQSAQGGGNAALPAHLARHPSRWVPTWAWPVLYSRARPPARAAAASAAANGGAGAGSGGHRVPGGGDTADAGRGIWRGTGGHHEGPCVGVAQCAGGRDGAGPADHDWAFFKMHGGSGGGRDGESTDEALDVDAYEGEEGPTTPLTMGGKGFGGAGGSGEDEGELDVLMGWRLIDHVRVPRVRPQPTALRY